MFGRTRDNPAALTALPDEKTQFLDKAKQAREERARRIEETNSAIRIQVPSLSLLCLCTCYNYCMVLEEPDAIPTNVLDLSSQDA